MNFTICECVPPRTLAQSIYLTTFTKIFGRVKYFMLIPRWVWLSPSLSDCLTAEQMEILSHLTTRGLFDGEELGSVLVITKNKYHNQGLQRSIKKRTKTHTQCTGQVEYWSHIASLMADETLQVCWVCNHGLGSGMFVFSPLPLLLPLHSPVVSPGAGYSGGSALTLVRTHKSHKIDSVTLGSGEPQPLGTGPVWAVSIFEEVHRTP